MAKLFDLYLHSIIIAELLVATRLMGILIALLISLLACSLEKAKQNFGLTKWREQSLPAH